MDTCISKYISSFVVLVVESTVKYFSLKSEHQYSTRLRSGVDVTACGCIIFILIKLFIGSSCPVDVSFVILEGTIPMKTEIFYNRMGGWKGDYQENV